MRTTSKKWSRLAWQALRVLPLGLLGLACDGRLSEPAVGGESSFLRACAGQCGDGLECISSVCTQGCLLSKDTCGKLDDRATCTNASIETGNVAVCDIACSRDSDCSTLGSRFRCEGGFCRGANLGTGNAQGGGTGTTIIGGSSSVGGATGVGGVGGSMPSTIGSPTAGSCRVAYQEYASGTTGIPIADGSSCGTCTCSDGKIECVKLDDCPLGTPVVPCTDLKTDAADERLPFIAGDSLSLTVGHGGGCATHDYAMCYEQGIGASVPEYVWLHLIHDGHGDACDAYVSKPLTFDLRPLARHLAQNFSPIHLVNTPYGLYVFGEAATCEERTQAARNQILTSFDAVTKSCNTDADCTVFSQSASCYPSCDTVVSTLAAIDSHSGITPNQLSARLTAVDAGQCSRMQELQCPVTMVDCARAVPACMNNQCVNSAL